MRTYTHTAGFPPSFFPDDLDTTGFIDVTSPIDPYRVLLDPSTGTLHRGWDYFKEYAASLDTPTEKE